MTRLIAKSIDRGVIAVLTPDEGVVYYAQRGIGQYSYMLKTKLVDCGILQPLALTLPELPKKYSIIFEEPHKQGRAYATFNPKRSPNYNRYLDGLRG